MAITERGPNDGQFALKSHNGFRNGKVNFKSKLYSSIQQAKYIQTHKYMVIFILNSYNIQLFPF